MGEALKRGLAFLSQLGEGLPNNLSQEELDEQTQHTIAFAMTITPEHILNYKRMTDPTKATVIRVLAQLLLISHHAKAALYPYFLIKMVSITFSHGLSPQAPTTFSAFGSYLANHANSRADIELGARFIMIGKSLINQLDASDYEGSVMIAEANTKCYLEPAPAALELMLEGERRVRAHAAGILLVEYVI